MYSSRVKIKEISLGNHIKRVLKTTHHELNKFLKLKLVNYLIQKLY